MFCPNCGTSNVDNAVQCSNCGQSLQAGTAAPGPRPDIPNYLVQAILVTVFCCLPFGIVSIIFAAQVNGKIAAGDYAGAMNNSQKARTWAWVAFGCGLAVILIQGLLMLAGGGMRAASHY